MTDHPLTRILARYRSTFLALAVFSLFFNLLVLTLPVYMMSVFTHVLASRSQETLILLTVAALVALTIQGLLDFLRGRVLVRVGMSMDAEMTPHVLEAVIRHAAGSTQRNAQRLRDAAELRAFLTSPTVFTLFDAPFAPLYVLILYLVHPLLGGLALVGCVILFGIAWANEYLTREPVKTAMNLSLRSQRRVEELVRNADAVEAMGMMPAVLGHWRGQNSESLDAQSLGADRAGVVRTIAGMVRMMLQVGLYAAGAYLYLHQELLTGAIIAAAILMARALAPVEVAIKTWRDMIRARDAYDRLKEALAPERMEPYRNRMSLPTPEGRLQLDRLVVGVAGTDRLILKGIGFSVEPGEFLGVVGPSGAGKTTLAKLIVGIVSPRGGSARLDGVDLSSWNPDELGRHIGYLPQDVQLFQGTVRENIARLAQDSNPDDVVAAAKAVGVHETILQLPNGYDTDVGDAGCMLSAGQRQHIALARAMYGSPKLLVLDEPNSNLDSLAEAALLKALDEAKKAGVTVVVITHRPSILRGADKMLMLRSGMVELFGPRAQVMAQLAPAAQGGPQQARKSIGKDQPGPTLVAKGENP